MRGLAPDFKRLMATRFQFTFGVQMQAVLIGWRMYDLTHDPLYLGLIGLAEAVPAIGLALFAGYIVDRNKPLPIYRGVVFTSFVSALILLASLLMDLNVAQQVLALFAASVVTGTARGFSQPAVYALVPKLIPRDQLPRSSAWMTTTLQVARIAGPAVGGLIFGWLGAVATSLTVCAFLLGAQTALLLVKTSPPAPPKSKQKRRLKEELLSGARFVFKHPILFPALTLDMVSVLFGGVTALLPIFASEILMTGPKGLGLLRAAPAVGAAVMSIALTRRAVGANAGPVLFASVGGFGLCILVFGLSRSFPLSLLALALSGMFDSVSMIIRTSAVQLSSPDELRGRISAVNSIFIGSSNELGELESGIAAKLLGTVPAVIFGGVMCLLTVGATALLAPRLRKLDLKKLAESPRVA